MERYGDLVSTLRINWVCWLFDALEQKDDPPPQTRQRRLIHKIPRGKKKYLKRKKESSPFSPPVPTEAEARISHKSPVRGEER